jgi:hypothetical protein
VERWKSQRAFQGRSAAVVFTGYLLVEILDFPLAGFQVTPYGRIEVTPEDDMKVRSFEWKENS